MAINIKTDNLIYPYFVIPGSGRLEEIDSFPGIPRFSTDLLLKDIGKTVSLGLNKILIFGIPEYKDKLGSGAFSKDSIVPSAVKAIKKRFPSLIVITDICLCAYTSHGHCGVIKRHSAKGAVESWSIDIEPTLEALAKMALSHARAGADWVAPSAMAKGQVKAIREELNRGSYIETKIMGYSAKFASNYYGPFRNAAKSAPKIGDRTKYQLDYTDRNEAMKRIGQDIREGADAVMVKPALSYLDIVYEAKKIFSHPLAAYNVSGEYAYVKYGAAAGLWDEKKMVLESIASIKRAGADYIITYHAKDIAKWLKEETR